MKTVVIKDGENESVGEVEAGEVGDMAEITLHDENGNSFKKIGEILHVLK